MSTVFAAGVLLPSHGHGAACSVAKGMGMLRGPWYLGGDLQYWL